MLCTKFEPWILLIVVFHCTIRPCSHIIKDGKIICNDYEIGGVDDQHPHGESVGKYAMVNRVKIKLHTVPYLKPLNTAGLDIPGG